MNNKKPYSNWNDVKKDLNISSSQEIEIQLEEDIIRATIEAREQCKLSQRDLSEKSGVKQPAIARLEKCVNSPQVSTLIKLLYPMGYTLRVVPLKNINKK